jgi:hypothetical protein
LPTHLDGKGSARPLATASTRVTQLLEGVDGRSGRTASVGATMISPRVVRRGSPVRWLERSSRTSTELSGSWRTVGRGRCPGEPPAAIGAGGHQASRPHGERVFRSHGLGNECGIDRKLSLRGTAVLEVPEGLLPSPASSSALGSCLRTKGGHHVDLCQEERSRAGVQ